MKKLSRIIAPFLLLTILWGEAQSQYLKADGKKIVRDDGKEIILRGMGLGGWMLQEGYMLRVGSIPNQQHKIKAKIEELIGKEKTQDFYDAWLANHMRRIDIDSMAAWGFNSVRLPMHYNLYTLPIDEEPVKGQDTWLEKGFEMTDKLLQWCKNHQMYLILDLHAAPGGQGNDLNISDRDNSKPSLWESEENQRKMIAFWRKIAERYAGEPYIGFYDIINEPNWGFESAEDKNGCSEKKNEDLKRLMMEITRAIREVDQKHMIAIEGNCWGNNYNGILPTWDDNMLISFHKYWNYNDQASIQKMLDIREQNQVPIWLGETGENSNLWFRDAIRLFESNHIGWAWWPLKKIGFNNPLEIKMNPYYQKVVNYWNEKGEKPTLSEAEKAFSELANDTKLENCMFHRDVIDAMFRQVNSNDTQPFQKHILKNKAIVYAVDYDLGRNGFAYYDKDTANYYISTGGQRTPWNRGRVYRNDGVDIQECKDASQTNGYQVSWIEDGEWLQYTLNAPQSGTYTVLIRIASDNDRGKILLDLNGNKLAVLPVPNTKGEQNWQSLELKGVTFKKGQNILRFQAEQGGFHLNYMQFVSGN